MASPQEALHQLEVVCCTVAWASLLSWLLHSLPEADAGYAPHKPRK